MNEELNQTKASVEGLETERDFYFAKVSRRPRLTPAVLSLVFEVCMLTFVLCFCDDVNCS